jgi:hypothetical protein
VRIDEILRISTQDFPLRNVDKLLSMARDGSGKIDDLDVWYLESGDQRIIILTDSAKEIAAYSGFISRLNGKVWQVKNLQTYGKHKGNKLGAKILKFVKNEMRKSLQSDIEQSPSSEKLWVITLPLLGLKPKIFDTETEYIIDQSNPIAYNNAMRKMYTSDETDNEKYRYTWILEHRDHYSTQNILSENQLLMPYKGIWYNFSDEK